VKRLVFFVDGVEFPPEAVETYIRAHEDAVVPPTVAAVHPDIIDRLDADVEPWVCEACTTQYAYSAVEADTAGERLVCPGVLIVARSWNCTLAAENQPADKRRPSRLSRTYFSRSSLSSAHSTKPS